jgi:hypothetical protein
MMVRLGDYRLDLGDHYLLHDFLGDTIYIGDMIFAAGDFMFLYHSRFENTYLGAFRDVYLLQDDPIGYHYEKSPKFRYVVGCNLTEGGSLYRRVNLERLQDDAQFDFSAFGHLLRVLSRKGLRAEILDSGEQVIGYYTGGEGGVGRLKDPDLHKGSEIRRIGLSLKITSKHGA